MSTMLAASEGRLSVEKGEAMRPKPDGMVDFQIPLPAGTGDRTDGSREKEIQIKAEGNILPIWSWNAWNIRF